MPAGKNPAPAVPAAAPAVVRAPAAWDRPAAACRLRRVPDNCRGPSPAAWARRQRWTAWYLLTEQCRWHRQWRRWPPAHRARRFGLCRWLRRPEFPVRRPAGFAVADNGHPSVDRRGGYVLPVAGEWQTGGYEREWPGQKTDARFLPARGC